MNAQMLKSCQSLARSSRLIHTLAKRCASVQTRNIFHGQHAAASLKLSLHSPKKCFDFQQLAYVHTTQRRFAFDEVEKGDQYCTTLEELKGDIENDNVLIVDVRRQDEVDAGRIPAKRFVHIPVQEVAEAFQMSNSEFKSQYGMDKPSKDAEDIVFHCFLGGRSTFALRIAHTLGFTKSRHFPGGWKEWSSKDA